jgi:hypothetical protein
VKELSKNFGSAKKYNISQAWWYRAVIPALRELRQEKHKFEPSLGYMEKHCLKKKSIILVPALEVDQVSIDKGEYLNLVCIQDGNYHSSRLLD